MATSVAAPTRVSPSEWSLMQLLKPAVFADPYPFYARLRAFEPVHWDAFLHSWVVTSYEESVVALSKFKASRAPAPGTLEAMGLSALGPYAALMLKQLMFMDAPQHTRLRGLCAVAFTPKRVETLRECIRAMAEGLLQPTDGGWTIDLIGDFASPLPGYAMTALLGLPQADHARLKVLTNSLAELIGNYAHEPERLRASVESIGELQGYFQGVVDAHRREPREGLISALLASEVEGARLTDDEVIANVILILVGGLEEATNLIGCSVLSLLRDPVLLEQIGDDPARMTTAVEELLRFHSPTQQTGRIAPEATTLGGQTIRKGDSVTIVLAAANRDPERFAEPERLDLARRDNKHLAFGYAAHYCMGAPLTRMVTQIALTALLPRLSGMRVADNRPVWRQNMGMRGLESLQVCSQDPLQTPRTCRPQGETL